MTSPTGTEVGLAYVGVVPSLAHIHESVATGAREAAKVYSTAFQAESVKSMSTASASMSQALSTALKPKMTAAGLEAGKSYSTGLGTGIKASQAEVTGSLAGINSAFKEHRQAIQDTTTKVEGFGLSTVAMSEKVTGTVHPLGTASTGVKGLGNAAKEAGGHLKGLATSVKGVGAEIGSVIASPLGLTAALGGAAAASGLLTDKLLRLGDVWEQVDRIMAVSSDATGDRLEALNNVVKDTATRSSQSIEGIATIVARLNGLTKDLSAPQLDTLTTQLSDLSVMMGAPVDVQGLVGAAHALGIADTGISDFADHLFAVSRTTGTTFDELVEQTSKYGYALKGLNIPMDEGVALLAELDKCGIPVAATMRAFTLASKTAAKEGIPFNQFMADAIKHMEQMKAAGKSADQIQGYATTKFGPKGGLAISDAFQQGILTSNSLTQAQNIQSASIEETFEKTRNLGDEFKILENTASVALAPIGKAITAGIGGSLDKVSTWIRTHGDVVTKWMHTIVDGAFDAGIGVLKAFQPMLEIIGKLEVAFGNLTGNDAIRASGVDLENFAKGFDKPGGVIDSLEKARGKTDDWFTKIQQTVGISELLGDALKPTADGKGLEINPKLDPKQAKDDIDRLQQYGVTVLQDPKTNKLTITASTPENAARVQAFLKEEGNKTITVKVVPVPGSPDVDHPAPHAPGTPGGPVLPPGVLPPRPEPRTSGPGPRPHGIPGWLDEIINQAPGDAGRWIHDRVKGHSDPKDPSLGKGWEGGGFAGGGFLPDPGGGGYLPGDSNIDNMLGVIPGKGMFGLSGGEGIVKTSMARLPAVKAIVHALNRGYSTGTDDAGSSSGTIFGIPIPKHDPNAPGAPPGGWSTKTQIHDQNWVDQQQAASRAVEHAQDRVEDLQESVDTYKDTLNTLTAKMQNDDPDELIADQKEYAKTLRQSNRAERDLLEAKQDVTTAQRKQVEDRDKPPESSGEGKGGSGEDLGKGIVKGIFQELGLGTVFGDFTKWGIFKTAIAALQDFLPLAMRHRGEGATTGAVPGSHGETFAYPGMQHDAAVVLPPGAADMIAQNYGPGGSQGPPATGPSVTIGPQGSGGGQPGTGGGPPTSGPYTNFPGSPNTRTSGYQVPQGAGGDGSKVQLASAIYSTLTQAGYTPQTAITAIAAGQFESGLNPNSMNPSQHHGVWQESADKPSAGFGQQLNWLLSEMAAQGGPAAFANDPANAFADKVERGGYSGGSKYDLGAAAALLGGAASGGGFPSGSVPSIQSTAFTGGGIGGPAATDTATSGLPRYGGIPGGTGAGQPIVGWMEQQVQAYNAATGSNLSISADFPGGPHGHPDDGGDHSARRAVDISGSQDQMAAFSNYWASNQAFVAATRQLIHDNPGFDPNKNIIGGHYTSGPGTYSGGVFQQHAGHVHLAMEQIPGDIGQLVAPGAQGASPYPTAPQAPQQQPRRQAPQVTLTSQSIGGDLGLDGLGGTDPQSYPWQTSYGYKHGTEPFSGFIGMLPGGMGDRIMHPFRGGAMGAAAGAAPPQPDAPAPPSAITATMMSRTAPDLATVGPGRGGEHVTNITHNYSGITTPKAIAPAIMDTHLAATRATVPRTI
jgi:hypothetical protein